MSSQEQTPCELSIVIVNPGGAGRGSGSGSRGGRGHGSRSGRSSRGGRGGHSNSSDNRSSTPVVQANNHSPEHWIEAEERALLTIPLFRHKNKISKHYDELTHPRDNNHCSRTWDAIIEDFKKECTPLASPIVTDGTQESEQSLDEQQPAPSSLVVEPSSISSDDQATSLAAAATAATDPSASDLTNDNSTVETFGNVRTKRAIKTKWERMCSRYHSCFTERHRTLQPSARRRRLTPAELRHEDVLERIDAANQQSEEARSQLIELLDQQHKEILEAQERRH
ncbi:hypothetical protein BDB00DRAFT_863768 [Zychaea mexicana]|uniref:uncharacterized protein n=1 Tax=Zychaea mexicana TaxID=64656 RepID=UPI0022FE6B8A|nr:uncharacterized protein BDB00DRAFT_863768 [Zychaea mexicana]KAI9468417.1 hypothetical protein BDB00DRAFT_863768 [Zychaea mexicana]